MDLNLPESIRTYIDASNAHNVESILTCFSDNATVQDEGETLTGKKAIERWLAKTIEKYHFQFKPLTAQRDDTRIVVRNEVSGTFNGSPVALDFHFTLEEGKISSLAVK